MDPEATHNVISVNLVLNTEISLNSVMEISNPKTLKLRGTIKDAPVVVIVDPKATHNFISVNLVRRLEIVVTHLGYPLVLERSFKVKGNVSKCY